MHSQFLEQSENSTLLFFILQAMGGMMVKHQKGFISPMFWTDQFRELLYMFLRDDERKMDEQTLIQEMALLEKDLFHSRFQTPERQYSRFLEEKLLLIHQPQDQRARQELTRQIYIFLTLQRNS